jgi:hypothetical protein
LVKIVPSVLPGALVQPFRAVMATTSSHAQAIHAPTVVHLAWVRYKQQLQRNPLQTKARA